MTHPGQRVTGQRTTRRAVIAGTAAVGAGAALSACAAGGSRSEPGPGGSAPTATGPIAKTSQIPVHGGRVFDQAKVVVTQPEPGEFKAFSAVCTHAGCLVSTVRDDTIECDCHGSRYSAADGSVTGGPAPAPLPAEKVTVEGDEIVLG